MASCGTRRFLIISRKGLGRSLHTSGILSRNPVGSRRILEHQIPRVHPTASVASVSGFTSRFAASGTRNSLHTTADKDDTVGKDEEYSENDAAQEKQQEQDEDTLYESGIKLSILESAMDFVMDKGWTKESLALGAEKMGYPGIAHGLFPKGGVELVYHFYSQSNSRLNEELRKKPSTSEGIHDRNENSAEEIMRNAMEARLRMNIPYVLAGRWTEALGLMALPQNAQESLRHLAVLVDDIWHLAGDTSSDFSWYTKRAALAGVYEATELHMLQDNSIDFEETWNFLGRRIRQMQDLRQCEQRCVSFATQGTSVLGGLFQTVLNMANVNSNRR